MYWSSPSWSGFFYVYYMISDCLAPVLFITMTIIGTFASRFKLEKKNAFIKSDYMRHLAEKSSYFLLIGTIFNIGFDAATGFHEGAWALIKMNIFSAVVIAQVIAHLVQNAKPGIKLVMLISLLIVKVPLESVVTPIATPAIMPGLFQNLAGILYFVLFVGNPIGLLDTIIIAFLVTLIAEQFVRCAIYEDRENIKMITRNLFHVSILLVLISILCGGLATSSAPGEAAKFLESMGSAWPMDAIPLFLVRHSSWNLLFKVGVVLALIVVLYRLIDGRGKDDTIVVRRIATCGAYSFSIYVYHNISAFVPLHLTWYGWIIASLLLSWLLVVIFNAWNDKLRGTGSFEWGARQWVALFRVRQRAVRELLAKR